jgi:hypothetical protein
MRASLLALILGGAAGAQTLPPTISTLSPMGGRRGSEVEITLTGRDLGTGNGLVLSGDGVSVNSVTPDRGAQRNADSSLKVKLRIAPDASPGFRTLRVVTPYGPSGAARFAVGQWPEVTQKERNDSPELAQTIPFPCTMNGLLRQPQEVDYYRFHAARGQMLIFEVAAARLGSPLDSVLTIRSADGHELAFNDDFYGADSLIRFPVPADGDYILSIHDLRYQGGSGFQYRLSMGELPFIATAQPLAGQAGSTLRLEVSGYNLGGARQAKLTLPRDAPSGPTLQPAWLANGASCAVQMLVTNAPVVSAAGLFTTPVPVPGVASGTLPAPQTGAVPAARYRFHARLGQKLSLTVEAPGPGSDLDPLLTVLDRSGKVLARNDGAQGFDSLIEFTAPAEGDFDAVVGDLHRRGGPGFEYALRIATARPDFELTLIPGSLAVCQGDGAPLRVKADRLNGFSGDIAIALAGVPAGLTVAGPGRIAAGESEATLILPAAANAPIGGASVSLVGTANVENTTVRHQAAAVHEEKTKVDDRISVRTAPDELPTISVAAPADIALAVTPAAAMLPPGGTIELTVRVSRLNGYSGRVPIRILGLPAGVSANDNLEIPEKQSETKVTLKAGSGSSGRAEITLVGRVILDELHDVPHCSAPVSLQISKPH